MGDQRRAVSCLACAAILVALAATPADARHRLGAHIEGGFGQSSVRPLVEESASGATASAGLSTSLVPFFRVGLEVSATAGGGSSGKSIPESSRPGNRSLTTLLVGIEATSQQSSHGPFAFVGAGVGHSTLKDARGIFEPPYGDNWLIPSRNKTAFALGGGAGYRFGFGPGPFGFQFGFRAHALVDAGQIPSSAYAVTVGLAY